jgi:hypothetical protein
MTSAPRVVRNAKQRCSRAALSCYAKRASNGPLKRPSRPLVVVHVIDDTVGQARDRSGGPAPDLPSNLNTPVWRPLANWTIRGVRPGTNRGWILHRSPRRLSASCSATASIARPTRWLSIVATSTTSPVSAVDGASSRTALRASALRDLSVSISRRPPRLIWTSSERSQLSGKKRAMTVRSVAGRPGCRDQDEESP